MVKSLLSLLFIIALSFFVGFNAWSQTTITPPTDDKAKPDDKSDATSSFKFGISYLSNNVYMGRTDTSTTPVIIPEAKYTFKNGIYFSGSLYFIPTKPTQKLDGGNVAGGYDWDISDAFSVGGSFTKLFYSSNSAQITSSISSTVNVNVNYDNDYISPALNVNYDLNSGGISNDFLLSPAVAHDFIFVGIFGDADIFLISPTVTLNAGTENFYDGYINKRTLKSKVLTKVQTALLTRFEANVGKFEILDYEISAPLEYKIGHLIIQVAPTYAIVQNQLPKALAAQFSDQSAVFYVEAGVSLKF